MSHLRFLQDGRARLNMAHPALRGATLAQQMNGSGTGFAVTGQQVFPCTGGTPVVTPIGPAEKANNSSTPIFTTTSEILGASTTTSYTLLAIATASNSGIQSAFDHDNGSTRRFQFRLNAGKVELIPFDASNNVLTTVTAPVALTAAEAARGFLMMAVVSPGRTAIVQNNTVIETTNSSTPAAPSSSVWIGARQAGNQGWTTGGIAFVVMWPRALTNAELVSIASDPGALFEQDEDYEATPQITAASSVDATAPVSGTQSGAASGTVAATGGATSSVTGSPAAGSAGGVTASGAATASATGSQAATQSGATTASGTATATATGSQASAQSGQVNATAGGAGMANVSGIQASAASGIVTTFGSANATATGSNATARTGSVTATASGNALAGVVGSQSTGQAGGAAGAGDATSSQSGVGVTVLTGQISAVGGNGSAVVYLAGVSAASASGVVTAVGTRTGITVNVTEDMISAAVRRYILGIAQGQRVLRTPVNRAAMPNGAYVSFTPGLLRPLSTNVSSYTANSRTVHRPEQMAFQIDCYGAGSSDLAETLNTLFRDEYAVEQFAAEAFEIAPLYAGNIMQAPFVNDADQYEERYTFEIEVQVNRSTTVPSESCNILDIDLVSVEAHFPPTEE